VFALIVFFVVWAALLLLVDVEEWQRVAKEVEEGGVDRETRQG
jgi:hypothetical protein